MLQCLLQAARLSSQQHGRLGKSCKAASVEMLKQMEEKFTGLQPQVKSLWLLKGESRLCLFGWLLGCLVAFVFVLLGQDPSFKWSALNTCK